MAAGAALGVSELVCGLAGSSTSLVTAVGTQFIDRFAAELKDVAVSLFGTNDKVALVVGIVVVSIALGALLGMASIRRPWIGIAGFAAFGVVGLLSYLDDPLAEPWIGVVAAILAVAAGVGDAVRPPPPRSTPCDDLGRGPADVPRRCRLARRDRRRRGRPRTPAADERRRRVGAQRHGAAATGIDRLGAARLVRRRGRPVDVRDPERRLLPHRHRPERPAGRRGVVVAVHRGHGRRAVRDHLRRARRHVRRGRARHAVVRVQRGRWPPRRQRRMAGRGAGDAARPGRRAACCDADRRAVGRRLHRRLPDGDRTRRPDRARGRGDER